MKFVILDNLSGNIVSSSSTNRGRIKLSDNIYEAALFNSEKNAIAALNKLTGKINSWEMNSEIFFICNEAKAKKLKELSDFQKLVELYSKYDVRELDLEIKPLKFEII